MRSKYPQHRHRPRPPTRQIVPVLASVLPRLAPAVRIHHVTISRYDLVVFSDFSCLAATDKVVSGTAKSVRSGQGPWPGQESNIARRAGGGGGRRRPWARMPRDGTSTLAQARKGGDDRGAWPPIGAVSR